MKLGIGTVQFGLKYGISNTQGQTTKDEVQRILRHAEQARVNLVDTAAAYGESEVVLGEVIGKNPHFRIVSKVPKLGGNFSIIEESIKSSLRRLQRSSIEGIMFHDPSDLLGENGEQSYQSLLRCRESGLVEKIGVSVYDGAEIDEVLKRFSIDIIQVPANVFDQRLLQSGHLRKLKDRGVEIHVRSAFLQGLCFMDSAKLNPYFEPVAGHLGMFHEHVSEKNMTVSRACLAFLNQIPEVDIIVCGINNTEQLEQLISEIAMPATDGVEWGRFALTDPKILNPSLWKLV